jgi:uncharacterized protein (TIGR03067 family)
MGVSFVLILGGLSIAVGEGAADAARAELKRLQGTWVHVSTERNGEKRPEPLTLWVFDENRAKVHHQTRPINADPKTWRFEPNRSNLMLTYHFKLDPSRSPKALDQSTQYNSEKTPGKPRLAIYKLEGDTLTICYAGYYDKGNRPLNFTAANGSDRAIYILKREKK